MILSDYLIRVQFLFCWIFRPVRICCFFGRVCCCFVCVCVCASRRQRGKGSESTTSCEIRQREQRMEKREIARNILRHKVGACAREKEEQQHWFKHLNCCRLVNVFDLCMGGYATWCPYMHIIFYECICDRCLDHVRDLSIEQIFFFIIDSFIVDCTQRHHCCDYCVVTVYT